MPSRFGLGLGLWSYNSNFSPSGISSGLMLSLRADSGCTTVDAAVSSPNDISNAAWTKSNVGSINTTTYSDDGTNGVHQILQIAIPNLQVGHTAHYRIDIPLVGGTGRYVIVYPNNGGSFVRLDTTGAGSIIGSGNVSNLTYISGVLEFDITVVTSGNGIFFRTSPDGVTDSYVGTGRTITIGPGTNGHNAIEVTQKNLSVWNDLSSVSHHTTQITATRRPQYLPTGGYNGGPAIYFAHSRGDNIFTSAFTLNQPSSVFVVAKYGTATSGNTLIDGLTGNTRRICDQGGIWSIFAGAPQPLFNSVDTNRHALQAVYNGTSSVFRIDGTDNSPVSTGTASASGVRIGGFDDAANFSWEGLVEEVAVWNRDLTLVERIGLYNYAKFKYGIT